MTTTPPSPETTLPWWGYLLIVLTLPIWLPIVLALAMFWWVCKAMGFSFEGFARMWVPQRIPARFRNHGRGA